MTLPEAVGADGGWQRPSGVSVFKSVGTAVQDLAAARAVASEAAARGVGREVDLLTPKTF
jgi:ornithine cyclodeaminase/alanine dehydrogenase-like protein (mu-crystallin family)